MIKIVTITSCDGYPFKIKYMYPENVSIDKLVIYVNGSGPQTYDNKRRGIDGSTFNYHEYFAHEFSKRNVAYCSYNTRGVDIGDNEPLFIDINDEEYQKYLPSNSVKDIEAIILHLVNVPIFRNAKIYLLGWSEGTIIAPLVALNNNVKVDALLLAGYVNENMKHTLTWQLRGNSSYINLQRFFDSDRKGYITKKDFEADVYGVKIQLLGNVSFEDLDMNNDGKVDVSDFAARQLPYLDNILNAIENDDDVWLKNNYGNRLGFVLKSAWFKEHFELKANKEILPLLDIPIYIFHGEKDASCPKNYAEDIKHTFAELGKNNLSVNIFDGHDHDLNFGIWLVNNTLSKGISCIFDTVDSL